MSIDWNFYYLVTFLINYIYEGTYIIPRAWFLTYSGETKRLHYFRLHFTHTHYICNCCMTSIYYIFAVCKNYDAKDAYVTALHDLHWSVHLLFYMPLCCCLVQNVWLTSTNFGELLSHQKLSSKQHALSKAMKEGENERLLLLLSK